MKISPNYPKKGLWENNKCSVCGTDKPQFWNDLCPNCGSRMIVLEDEKNKVWILARAVYHKIVNDATFCTKYADTIFEGTIEEADKILCEENLRGRR